VREVGPQLLAGLGHRLGVVGQPLAGEPEVVLGGDRSASGRRSPGVPSAGDRTATFAPILQYLPVEVLLQYRKGNPWQCR
jgi:hypothetical protein